MKVLNLTIVSIAIAIAASTMALAANTDSNGNIPNHDNDKVTSYSDSFGGGNYIDQTVRPASRLSSSDALLLKLNTDRDQNSKGR